MSERDQFVRVPPSCSKATVIKVKTRRRQSVTPSTVVCIIKPVSSDEITFNGPGYGQVTMLCQEGASICANEPLFKFQACQHHVVMRDLCAECGANLRKEGGFCGERTTDASASIPMVHMIPELHVSESVAAEIALQDEKALLNSRKLVLLIDLDQTVLHTTIDGQAFRYKNVHRFRLPGCPLIYHTRFRPHLNKFLERISRRFQLHICTFGNRAYAHQLASILDPKRQYFCQRILSRDECFNPVTKSANLKALFPRGVHLVCIIDDRGDVWDWSPNLIHVQPYRFFPEVGDINGPPGRPLSLPPTPDFRPIPSELVTPPPSPSPQDSSVTSTSTASETPASEATTPSEPSDPPAEGASTKAKELATVASTATDATAAAESNCSDEPKGKDSQQRPKTVETPSHMPSGVDLRSVSIQRPETLFEMSEETLDSFDADYLLRLEQILLKIHRNYYRAYAKQVAEAAAAKNTDNGGAPSQYMGIPHVANIISQLRSKVLGPETHITLSGLTPTHRPASRCLAGQLAIGLGSTLHNRLRLPAVKPAPIPSTVSVGETSKKPDSMPETGQPDCAKPHKSSHAESRSRGRRAYTTHLVACRLNTEKVIAAQLYTKRAAEAASAGGAPLHRIHIVSPRWLWASHFRWEHLPEDQFPLDRDYLVSTFDPDVDSYPGSYRIGRRVRHFPAFAQPSICRQSGRALTAGAANSATSTADGLSTTSSSCSATVSPTVDLLTVRSAIASIRAEEEAEAGGRTRSRRPPVRKRRRNHSEPLPSPVVVEDDDRLSASAARHHCSGRRAKRACHRISDGELTLSTMLQASSRHMTPAVGDATTDAKCPTSSGALDLTSRSPSISMDEEDEEKENEGGTDSSKPGTDVDSPETSQEPTTHLQTPAPQSVEAAESAEAATAAATAAQNEDVDVISDAGEDDLNSTTEETNVGEEEEVEGVEADDGVDGTAGGTSRPRVEEEEDIEAELKNYLPPPCPLDLAENPLLHMPPQAASQMLTEIEEAVLEEQEERASSVPREMEIYDDDDDSSTGSSSTSSSSSQASLNGTRSETSDDDDDDDDDGDGRRGGGGYSDRDGNSSSRELDQEERWLQIRRQLLLRKRGPDHGELAEVEKKLERIKRGRQGSAESRLTVHTHSNRHAYSDHSLSHQHHRHRHHHYWTRRLHSATGSSPGIHSDPELSSNGWWGVGDQSAVAVDPVASALLDQRDWNTCPEGYDYEDAERARALLRPETRRNTTSSGARRRGRKPGLISAAACLEGVTGLFGETSGSSDDDDEDEKPTVDAAVNSSSSSSSTHEDDEDDNEDLSVVTLEALKEFM